MDFVQRAYKYKVRFLSAIWYSVFSCLVSRKFVKSTVIRSALLAFL